MSRNITGSIIRELQRCSNDAVIIPFLTFSSLETADTIRVVSDGADYILNGNTYYAIPFDFNLLSDTDTTPEVRLSVPNIDRSIGDKIKQIQDPITLRLELYDADDFDLTVDPRTHVGTPTPVYVAQDLLLRDVSVNVLEVSGTVRGWDIRSEFSSKLRATEDRCPALYL